MRIAFLLTLVAYAVLVVVAALVLPERVPLHFGFGGEADRWGTRTEAVLTFGLLGAGLAVVLGGGAELSSRLPLRSPWVNLPHKAWWTATPEREMRACERLRHDLYVIATAVMVLVSAVLVLTLVAARTEEARLPGGSGLSIGVLVVVLVGGLALVLWQFRRFRPEGES